MQGYRAWLDSDRAERLSKGIITAVAPQKTLSSAYRCQALHAHLLTARL